MLLKALTTTLLTAVITLRLGGDTSIADTNSQMVTRGQLLSRDTSVTPYTRLPVSTDLATRDRLQDCRNLRQSTAICRFPLYSATFH